MFDTTGSGYFDVRGGYEPDTAELEALIAKKNIRNVRITLLREVEVPEHEAVYEVAIAGLR